MCNEIAEALLGIGILGGIFAGLYILYALAHLPFYFIRRKR